MSKQETVDIKGHEYLKAIERWFDFWPTSDEKPSFNEFIGITSPPLTKVNNEWVMSLPPEAARRIRLLNSPYHYAILTAYSITKEINNAR